MTSSMHTMLTQVKGSDGYSLALKLDPEDRAVLEECIRDQYIDRIRQVSPEHAKWFQEHDIGDYHRNCHVLDHGNTWNKAARILSATAVAKLRSRRFMRRLEEAFGAFDISGESGIQKEEVYWRLVRPGMKEDVGPVHADRWFWDLGNGVTPEGVERVKIWIAVATEAGRNGLQIVPNSHTREWRWHGENRDGIRKPVFDEDPATIGLELPEFTSGQAIVFNDNLLHAGAVNQGEKTRVSVEFTMFTRPQRQVTAA